MIDTPKDSSIVQIKIPACVDGGELAGLLACPEFFGLWEEAGTLTTYWRENASGRLSSIHSALAQLGEQVEDAAIQEELVPPQDWNAQWVASVKPINIGRRIGIRPSWTAMAIPEDGIEIVLDPRQAFGTGHHATTQLLLEWLEDLPSLSGVRILDVGTGSGILSMVAIRLGALSALGIDQDGVAIDCAKEYAGANGFGSELDLRVCRTDELPGDTFEIIVANIDRNTILELSPEFSRFRASTTQLFLSGLLEEDLVEIVQHLTSFEWAHQATRSKENWIALQFGVGSSG